MRKRYWIALTAFAVLTVISVSIALRYAPSPRVSGPEIVKSVDPDFMVLFRLLSSRAASFTTGSRTPLSMGYGRCVEDRGLAPLLAVGASPDAFLQRSAPNLRRLAGGAVEIESANMREAAVFLVSTNGQMWGGRGETTIYGADPGRDGVVSIWELGWPAERRSQFEIKGLNGKLLAEVNLPVQRKK